MTLFKLKAIQKVAYLYEVEAETIEDAIDMVESGDADDVTEIDSTNSKVIAYAEDGVAGWNEVTGDK